MLIKEFKIIMPLTVEEYQIGQLFSVAEASKMETGGGEGVEVLENKAFDDPNILSPSYPKGQYTFKIYHLKKKVPKLINLLLPSGSTEVHEHAWNAYPYCRTILTNPTYMKENFMVKIETIHAPDRGTQCNAHDLSPELLKKREVQTIDISKESTEEEKKFISTRTNRGPLAGDWIDKCEPVMCAYKLVTVEFKWLGIQGKVESYIMKQEARIFSDFHRQLWSWVDRWHGLTMKEIRALEAETQRQLDEQRRRGPLRGLIPDED